MSVRIEQVDTGKCKATSEPEVVLVTPNLDACIGLGIFELSDNSGRARGLAQIFNSALQEQERIDLERAEELIDELLGKEVFIGKNVVPYVVYVPYRKLGNDEFDNPFFDHVRRILKKRGIRAPEGNVDERRFAGDEERQVIGTKTMVMRADEIRVVAYSVDGGVLSFREGNELRQYLAMPYDTMSSASDKRTKPQIRINGNGFVRGKTIFH